MKNQVVNADGSYHTVTKNSKAQYGTMLSIRYMLVSKNISRIILKADTLTPHLQLGHIPAGTTRCRSGLVMGAGYRLAQGATIAVRYRCDKSKPWCIIEGDLRCGI